MRKNSNFSYMRQILPCSSLFFLDLAMARPSKKCLDQKKICHHIKKIESTNILLVKSPNCENEEASDTMLMAFLLL